METFFLGFVTAGVVMAVIDVFWLGLVANSLYKRELGGLLRKKANLVSAVLFYVLYVVGIVVFAVLPANGWIEALGYGALFGLIAYATYDLTNHATLKNFPAKIVVIDMTWGTFLTAVVAAITYTIVR